jgi:hypothetical protein
MRVLVVWEPILPTDWSSPSGSTLGRISDARVKQFYDPNHVVSGKLKDIAAKEPPQPEPNCCVRKGFYWDEAILYRPHTVWKDEPSSAFWDGPVVRIIPALERTIAQH